MTGSLRDGAPGRTGPDGLDGRGAVNAAGAAEADTLRDVCRALDLNADAAQIEAMLGHLALLRRWNAVYNLTAVRDPQAMLRQHLADCLAAVAAVQRSGVLGERGRILDVGSGGGLPGVPLAIHLTACSVTCIDSVSKKVAFVRQVAGALGLSNLHAEHARVEKWREAPFDLITARAFASLAELVRLTRSLLKDGGIWMAMKGQPPQSELVELPADIEVFHVEQLTVPGMQASRCLVWMRLRRDS